MFHKVKTVSPLPDFKLKVDFCEGETKIYDVKPLFDEIKGFDALKKDPMLFSKVAVDMGGYGIAWNDEIDLSCDSLWYGGEAIGSGGIS